MKRTISILLLFLGITLLSQQTTAQKDLLKRAYENFKLLSTDIEKAFQEDKRIEKDAKKINAKEAELVAIRNQFYYYKKRNNDFKNMMATANSLFRKAQSYKMSVYQVIAKNLLFEAYAFSGLYDKAIQELNQGSQIMEKAYQEDSISITTQSILYISYSTYYYLIKEDYKIQLKYLILSGKEIEKLPEGTNKQKALYIHYSNLADIYIEANVIDSAEHYVMLSQSRDADCNCAGVKATNLSILGKIEIRKQNYQKAVSFFKEAEKIKGYKNHLNIEDLYDNIIRTYQKLNKEDSVKLYEAKKDSLNLSIAENKNKSLYNLLKEKKDNNPAGIYVLTFFLVAMAIFIFIIIRKNRILARQEKTSQQYLEKVSENPKGEDYSKLLKALKENDPAFTFYFEEAFPGFSSKLTEINPEISSSEIEFCALLKLKIPTKEIARYRFRAPQTIRNKKYLIRNRLYIPKEVDIYEWFDEL